MKLSAIVYAKATDDLLIVANSGDGSLIKVGESFGIGLTDLHVTGTADERSAFFQRLAVKAAETAAALAGQAVSQ